MNFKGSRSYNLKFKSTFDRVNFTEAQVNNSCFNDSYFSYADFTDSMFNKVEMKVTTITDSSFKGITLQNADFTGSYLSRIDHEKSYPTESTKVKKFTIFNRVNFKGAIITFSKFENINCIHTDFNESFKCQVLLGGKLLKDYPTKEGKEVYSFSFDNKQRRSLNKEEINETFLTFKERNKRYSAYTFEYMPKHEYDELEEVDLSNLCLSNRWIYKSNLPNSDLSETELTNSRIFYSNLSNSDLRRINLEEAKLVNVDLSRTVLTGANFKRVRFEGVNFSNADLRGVRNFKHAIICEADFTEADLSGLDLSRNVLLDEEFYLPQYLCRGKFLRTDLSNVNFTARYLASAVFLESDLSNSIMKDANFNEYTRFIRCDLSNIDFRGCRIYPKTIQDCILTNTKF